MFCVRILSWVYGLWICFQAVSSSHNWWLLLIVTDVWRLSLQKKKKNTVMTVHLTGLKFTLSLLFPDSFCVLLILSICYIGNGWLPFIFLLMCGNSSCNLMRPSILTFVNRFKSHLLESHLLIYLLLSNYVTLMILGLASHPVIKGFGLCNFERPT